MTHTLTCTFTHVHTEIPFINTSSLSFPYSSVPCSVVHELIISQHDTIQDEDEDSNSPLHLACINGHVGVAKVLITANCDIEARFVEIVKIYYTVLTFS